MLVNDLDVAVYKAKYLEKDIQPATVTVYDDWLRQAPNPLYCGKKVTFKQIKVKFMIHDDTDDLCLIDISKLVSAMSKCTVKFNDSDLIYDCTISGSTSARQQFGYYQLEVDLKSAFARCAPIVMTLSGTSQTIVVPGDENTSVKLTLTPSVDLGSVTLTGFGPKPITVNNLHAGADVVINERGIMTEADLDTVITETSGRGKWTLRKYDEPTIFTPDAVNGAMVPQKSMIVPGKNYIQRLVTDAALLYQSREYNYLGWLRTGLYVASAKTITFKFLHDDGVNVFLNGNSVYTQAYDETNDQWGVGYPSLTLSLVPGWNVLEFLWLQHYGISGIYGIDPLIGTLVDEVNAYHARNTGLPGMANKFPDVDLWSFPELVPGSNVITVDQISCSVKVEYSPKYS